MTKEANTNPCFSCAACCQDMSFPRASKEEMKGIFRATTSFIKLLPSDSPRYAADESAYQAVYYKEINGDEVEVALAGKCPLLGPDNKCRDYPNRPRACRNFEIGDAGCLIARKKMKIDTNETTSPESTKAHFSLRQVFARRHS